MKYAISIIMLFCCGCLPATQAEIQDLTNSISQILPAVREIAGEDNEKIDKVLKDVETINEKVATAEGPVEAIEKGWKASEPFNPYYGYGAAALAIIKLLTINKKSRETENKYAAAKQGMDKFRNDNPEKAAELYNDIGDARKARKVT